MIQFCQGIAEDIQSFVDSQLMSRTAGLDRESIEAHLRVCSLCGAERRRIERTRDLVAGSHHTGPPASIWLAIEASLRQDGRIADGGASPA